MTLVFSATSCMRGGNADKGKDGRLGKYDKYTVNDSYDKKGERRIMDTVEDFATDVERLPSRIRSKADDVIDGNKNEADRGSLDHGIMHNVK